MTAQIAVMNNLGIALASDSAVTVETDQEADKIYSSDDKLFQLSNVAPVAIMTSGNADFLGMPWETVIKVYRDQLGEKTFPKLSDYADSFFRFVRTAEMFPKSSQDEFVKRLVKRLLHSIWGEIDEPEDGESENMSDIVHDAVVEQLDIEKMHRKIQGFSADTNRVLQKKYGKLIAQEGKEFFEEENLSERTHRVLNALIFESFSRTNFRSMKSGIVFAGFGDDEYMPAYLQYAVEGMMCNRLRRHHESDGVISLKTTATIAFFAQGDVVTTFLSGVSPQFESKLDDALDDLLESQEESFQHVFGKECTVRQKNQLTAMTREKRDALSKKMQELKESHWKPIVDMVASLPKDDLAGTAEMLVNLTKFHRRVSSKQETVGGPIDVSLITKGDGFVWVKKKQYYPAELNPHKTGPA